MGQTAEGIKKFRQTMINKYGSEEAWRQHMSNNGQKGGTRSNNGGFASLKRDKDGLTGPQRSKRLALRRRKQHA